jgi:plasmid stability protein
MRNLSVRNVDPSLAKALDQEQRRTGRSLNQTVLDLLRRALGISAERPYSNGLRDLAGGWTEAEHAAFEEACRDFESIDEDLWK